jgi:hypothetical protein
MPERDQKRQRCQSSEQLLEFFWSDLNDFLSGANGDHGRSLVVSLRPGDKATISGVAARRLTPPQKTQVQKFDGKVLASLFGTKKASSSLIIFERAKLSTRSVTYLCWCN